METARSVRRRAIRAPTLGGICWTERRSELREGTERAVPKRLAISDVVASKFPGRALGRSRCVSRREKVGNTPRGRARAPQKRPGQGIANTKEMNLKQTDREYLFFTLDHRDQQLDYREQQLDYREQQLDEDLVQAEVDVYGDSEPETLRYPADSFLERHQAPTVQYEYGNALTHPVTGDSMGEPTAMPPAHRGTCQVPNRQSILQTNESREYTPVLRVQVPRRHRSDSGFAGSSGVSLALDDTWFDTRVSIQQHMTKPIRARVRKLPLATRGILVMNWVFVIGLIVAWAACVRIPADAGKAVDAVVRAAKSVTSSGTGATNLVMR